MSDYYWHPIPVDYHSQWERMHLARLVLWRRDRVAMKREGCMGAGCRAIEYSAAARRRERVFEHRMGLL